MAVKPYIAGLKPKEAANFLDGLVSVGIGQIAEEMLRKDSFPIIRGIQKGTVKYRRSDPNEHWQTWRELYEQLQDDGVAYGDCEDLCAAVAAELNYAGIPARTYVYKSGPRLYHVVVKSSRWKQLLDPSRDAGMEGNG